jgi:hypothetical protein
MIGAANVHLLGSRSQFDIRALSRLRSVRVRDPFSHVLRA